MVGDQTGYRGEAIEMRLSGMTLQEVADKFGCTREWVRQLTKGVMPKRHRPKAERLHDEMRAKRAAGMTVKDIAQEMGYHTGSVSKVTGSCKRSQVARFWDHVEVIPDSCWRWHSIKVPFGYGRMRWRNKNEYAHRVSYMIHKGEIPAGMVVMHTCDNPECTNPDHLRLGTQADNVRDRDTKGRYRMPSRETNTKYPDNQVREMRRFFGRGLATVSDLSRMYQIDYNYTWMIVTGRARRSVQ